MSINDDLEDLITRLSQSEKIDVEDVYCFFTPKLTKEELKLVELKDEAHLLSYSNYSHKFFRGGDPDVDPEEMKKSDSKDKFVYSSCWRRTKCLKFKDSPALKLPSCESEAEEIDISNILEHNWKIGNELQKFTLSFNNRQATVIESWSK